MGHQNKARAAIVKYCASCGEKKQRLTYPKDDPVACTMRCAALNWLGLMESGVSIYCSGCGEYDCGCRVSARCPVCEAIEEKCECEEAS